MREPRIGVVVSTYAGVPYIHLQMEARCRHYPHIPILIHDDSSHREDELRRLCSRYGAEFQTTSSFGARCRLGHKLGDLSAFLQALQWGVGRELDIVLKLSRRFVPLTNWARSLEGLALGVAGATFGAYYLNRKDSIRTDCLAISIPHWIGAQRHHHLVSQIAAFWKDDAFDLFVENVMLMNARAVSASVAASPRLPEIVPWPYLISDQPAYLWHDIHMGGDYFKVSNSWGLDYPLSAFESDPNI